MENFMIRTLKNEDERPYVYENILHGDNLNESEEKKKELVDKSLNVIKSMANTVNVGYAVYDILATAGVGYLVNDLVDAIVPDEEPNLFKRAARFTGKLAITAMAKSGLDAAIDRSLGKANKVFDIWTNIFYEPIEDVQKEVEESENE